MNILWTDTKNNCLANITAVFQHFRFRCRDNDVILTNFSNKVAAFFSNLSVKEVHLRGSHESCNEQVAWLLIKVLWCINLLNNTIFHNNDSGTKGHSLCLVMCYVDDRSAQSLMQLGDLSSHLYTKLCIQVGERLVHQEYLRGTNDCTSHSNSLSLSTGKSLRLTVKQFLQVKDLSCLSYHLVNFSLRNFSKLKAECHIIVYGHMWIQSVALEYHCDISILRLNVVYDSVTNLQCTGRNLLQTCDHTKCSRFSAS